MIARPEAIPASGSSPLQRQIILWQRELLRRAERRRANVIPLYVVKDRKSC